MTEPGEADLRRLYENAPLGMFQSTLAGRFTFVNDAFVRMLGYESRREVIALDIERDLYVDPARRDWVIGQGGDGRGVYGLQVDWRRRDGQVITVSLYANGVFDADGKITGYEGSALDITELLAAQGELRRSENTLRTLLSQVPALMWTTDDALRFTYAQGRGLELFDLRPGQLTGVPLAGFFGNRDPEFPPLRQHARALTGESVGFEFEYIGRVFAVSVDPLRDAQGAIVGTIGTAVDITEQRRLLQHLAATQRLESLATLAGGVAHDFNNLLIGMMGNADLALRAVGETHRARPYLENMQLAARRASELTNQLLAYSGRGQLAVRDLNLNEIVRETAELLRVNISKKAILNIDLAGDLPAVHGDAAQVRQVVMNLLTNASDALGGKAGLITVRTSIADLDDGRLAALTGEAAVPGRFSCLEVSDDGCGMPAETVARMFEPFFTTKHDGHGLGLAAVQGIMNGHRGALAVDTEVGEGTTVRVYFPALDKRGEDVVTGPSHAVELAGGKVLVVDDEDVVRQVCTELLKELGFEVVTAADGAAALTALEREPDIDVVLLDLSMPAMSGEDVYDRIREMAPELRIILCSGFDIERTSAAFASDPYLSFLKKPYRLDGLERCLAEALARGSD